ncbi:MAG: neutral/alkaline non-lysosomal ceramidase N-terminal domain-containing protein [Chthonomonadales bacterium]|nr:neutral/alkaline non-lysosomal ceramidase N-terminal domain-containing protein [Chthonomonadales bacterium]
MPLYAGVCETNITPPQGVWMAGYAFRPRGCTHVHDELHARAAVFNDGSCAVAILAMDLIALPNDLVARIREGIASAIGLDPKAIMLNCSHTHGGPNLGLYTSMGSRDEAYVDVLVRKLVGMTRQAAETMKPAQLAYGRAPVQIGVNRRQTLNSTGATVLGENYAGPVAPYIDVLSMAQPSGGAFGLLFSHACHGTTLGGDNLRITADFCGYAADHVRSEGKMGLTPLFLQGCCGNINPLRRSTYISAAYNGRILGEAALHAWRDATALYDDEPLSFAERTVELPFLPPREIGVVDAEIKDWERKAAEFETTNNMGALLHAQGMVAYCRTERAMAEAGPDAWHGQFPIQVLSIAGAKFVGLPAEVFVQYALDFDIQTDQPVFTLGCTNGALNYLPTAADYPLGGYEVEQAHRYYDSLMYTAECESIVRNAVYDMLGVDKPDLTPYSL